ncbi:hypothetical protein GCM10010170_013950 [Dactylosporangium salmoneum]|uniref:Phosphoenolpyruvate guanylyltransferase n=1 Tax=Dactylosporangium salmoneum TaxID=53361 RepID=A0ABP5SME2_9ACTN
MPSHGPSTTQPKVADRPAAWVAVVPVKPLQAAKTRLRGAVPEDVHPDLVLAMARDTVAAALSCRAVARVVVICDDPAICEELTVLGALCLPDAPAAGLNAALTYGAETARQVFEPGPRAAATSCPDAAGPQVAPPARGDAAHPEPTYAARPAREDAAAHTPPTDLAPVETGRAEAASTAPSPGAGTGRPDAGTERGCLAGLGVVALTADLPAMRPKDLESALVAAAGTGHRAFVPDLEGTGTVLLAAPAGEALLPHFGPGSAAAHARSGATRLDGDWPSLRRDVDTAADLDAAARLGLGTHTGQVLCTVA